MNTFQNVCKEAQELTDKTGLLYTVYCSWGRWTIRSIDATGEDTRFTTVIGG